MFVDKWVIQSTNWNLNKVSSGEEVVWKTTNTKYITLMCEYYLNTEIFKQYLNSTVFKYHPWYLNSF